jgi:hypothetical protein
MHAVRDRPPRVLPLLSPPSESSATTSCCLLSTATSSSHVGLSSSSAASPRTLGAMATPGSVAASAADLSTDTTGGHPLADDHAPEAPQVCLPIEETW